MSRRRDVVVELVGELAEPLQRVLRLVEVDAPRVANGFADVDRLEERQLVPVFHQELGQPDQRLPPRSGRERPPSAVLEGGARRAHGAVDVGVRSRRDLRRDLAGRRIDVVEGPAALRVGELPVDQDLRVGREPLGLRSDLFRAHLDLIPSRHR